MTDGSSRSKASPIDVIAAFDVGSNSIKMTVGRRVGENAFEEIVTRSITTRLSDGLETAGRLRPDRIDAAMTALAELVDVAREHGAQRLIGVATEAVRAAENGSDLLQLVRDRFGIELRTLSGDEEAALSFAGLDPDLDREGSVVVADIGGGSTEIIRATDGAIDAVTSYPIGSGRLTERYVTTDPPHPWQLEQVRRATVQTVDGPEAGSALDRLIVVGGTAEFLGRLLEQGWPATPEAIERLVQLMSDRPASDLAERTGADLHRARLLPAGAAMVAGLAEVFGSPRIDGGASGLRRGLLTSAFAEAS